MVLSSGALLKVFQKVLSEIWEPKGSERDPKGSERDPKGSQREPKGSQREPKGSQKGAKVRQGTFENTPCGKVSKKGREGRVPGFTFGSNFGPKSADPFVGRARTS